ncbi:AraC family transcriptional regulator [Cellulomonas sp. URHB0016]
MDGPHAHEFYVLVHVEHGGGTLRVDAAEWPLTAGDVCLVGPGEVVHGTTSLQSDARVWVAFFAGEALATTTTTQLTSRHHPLLTPFRVLEEGSDRVLRLPEPDRPSWAALLTVLAAETGGHPADPVLPGAREAATAALTLLLVSLARVPARPGPPDDEPASAGGTAASGWGRDALVTAVLDAVEAGFREPISTREIARALGYTTGHLTTVVRERSGKTVLEWLTERRMVEARRLLAETELTVAAVAGRTGFRDPAYLVRRFREQHGMTPLQWRRRSRS